MNHDLHDSTDVESQGVNPGFYFVGGALPRAAETPAGSVQLLQTRRRICESHTPTVVPDAEPFRLL